MKVKRSFIAGRMNKSFDERLVPKGEYIDAMNIRLGSTEESEIGAIENTKGNEKLTSLISPRGIYGGYLDNLPLSADAVCLGSVEDSKNETIYWFVHDPSNPSSPLTGKLDMIVSYDVVNETLVYHVVSYNDGDGVNTALNLNPTYLVNGIDLIDNLLFFTDNYNPPRRINVDSTYIDPIPEALNVIVKPPSESPGVVLVNLPGQENYLDTRFLAFAYRYKYLDGEYSALSQFSEIAFLPKPFSLSPETFDNEGMTNQYNSAQVTFNTGTSRVVGIDLVFKFANGTILNVVEKYIKEDEGWIDNTNVTTTFTNRKVYTTLTTSELLRLFDNVPHKAQAQTIMSNRLMYGNYIDGYNLTDSLGEDCLLNYNTELVSTPVDQSDVSKSLSNTTYDIDPSSTEIIPNSTLSIDMSDFSSELNDGGLLSITLRLSSYKFSGTGTLPTDTQAPLTITIIFNLQENYSSVYDMVSSTLFLQSIGQFTFTPITDCGTDSAGTSLTDRFNCQLTDLYLPSPGYDFNNSGITGINQGIRIVATPESDIFNLSMLSARYEVVGTPGAYIYEYFEILSSSVTFSKSGIVKSLHSDRDFEVGIVYMDEYNRSTTALVSSNNTIFVPPSGSTQKNIIRTTIPTTQKPPYWAARYKFVVKPSSIDYETIYSNIFFTDPLDNITYFLLEGDNQIKAVEGQRLRVKKDVGGPLSSRVETVILDISAKSRNFLSDEDEDEDIIEPSGLYMSLKANNFNLNTQGLAYLTSGRRDQLHRLLYPVYSNNLNYDDALPISPTNVPYKAWEIPSGSLVTISFTMAAKSLEDPDYGETTYTFEKTFTASIDYDNVYNFIVGDNIVLNNGALTSTELEPDVYQFDNLYDFTTETGGEDYITFGTVFPGIESESFRVQLLWRNPLEATADDDLAGQMYFGLRNLNDSPTYPGTIVSCEIIVVSGGNNIVFETLPIDSDSDIYYEGSDSYPITGGFHTGNVQTQTAVLPAIVDLSFFNCFTFGNGVESYKIRDRLSTPKFRLGERVTAVSQEDYKEAHRFADITYSGIYNEDTNINKLNEFNLALANFKTLEKTFGPIRLMSGRAGDILTLQEDKVSYVMAGKDLLTDASGGGVLTSVPLVLGQAIVRIENYGISNNPESYTEWGFDKFFTDSKRGAVIKLSGSGRQEELSVVSKSGMRGWFRDYFNLTPNTQKIGGYDPYMGEYVLSGNLNALPVDPVSVQCGTTQTVTMSESLRTWEIVFPPSAGEVTVNYVVGVLPIGEDMVFEVTYNGVTYSSGPVTSSGSFTFSKDSIFNNTATVEVTLSSDYETTYSVEVSCPVSNQLQVTQVGLNSDDVSGQFIHNQFYWTQGSYVSPTRSDMVMLLSSDDTINVSQFSSISGDEGSGSIPSSIGDPTTIRIQSAKIGSDDFVFNPAIHKLKYFLSSTEFQNNPSSIQSLLTQSTDLTPILNPQAGVYYYDIPYSQTLVFSPYLYLIYDYQNIESEVLCYSNTSALEACCSCVTCAGNTPYNSSLTPQVDSTTACGQTLTETFYHSGSDVCPSTGDNVYQESTMTTPLSTGYYKTSCGWIEVTPAGVVNNEGTC